MPGDRSQLLVIIGAFGNDISRGCGQLYTAAARRVPGKKRNVGALPFDAACGSCYDGVRQRPCDHHAKIIRFFAEIFLGPYLLSGSVADDFHIGKITIAKCFGQRSARGQKLVRISLGKRDSDRGPRHVPRHLLTQIARREADQHR